MTSKRTKALRKQQRAIARELLHSRLASPERDPSIHIMSSDRRDSSPHRGYSRPFSPPRGPRADHQDGGHFFTSEKIRPREQRDRFRPRSRSRSRSPDSDRRRVSDMYDARYRPETERIYTETYRPSYASSSPTRPPLPEARRTHSVNSSGDGSTFPKSDRVPPLKTSMPSDLGKKQQETESNKAGQSSRALNGTTSQDRAIKAPVSLSTPVAKMRPITEESSAVAVQAMGEIFKDFISIATSFSALKFQESTAKKRCDRRVTEFEKSKGHHEKFPSIKESQTFAKTDAEKDYKAVIEKVAEKKASLDSLAVRAAEHLIPALLAHGGRGSAEQENLQERVEGLERTIQGFQKLVEGQKALIEEQRKANQTVEEKNLALAKDLRAVQGQVGAIQSRVDSAVQKANDFEQAIQTLSSDLATAKGDAAKISTDNTQISLDLKAKAQKIEALTSQIEDIKTLRQKLKLDTFEETSQSQFKTIADKFGKLDKLQTGLVNHVTGLADDQAKFRETWTSLDGRVNEIENKPDITTLEGRLQKLEKGFPREVKESVTKELDALKDRIKQVERTPPPAQDALPPKPSSRALDNRVELLEKRMEPVSVSVDKVNTIEKNGVLNLKASDIILVRNEVQVIADQLKTVASRVTGLETSNVDGRKGIEAKVEERLKGLENDASRWRSTDKNLTDFKKRVSAIEDHQQRSSASSAPAPFLSTSASSSANMQPQSDEISSRIQNLEKKLDDVEGAQQDFETQWAGTVNEIITEESQKLQTRMASLEDRSTELHSSLQTLRESGLADKQAIITDISTMFVKQPKLLPFPTIDQVNNALAPLSHIQRLQESIQKLQESGEATSLSLGNLQTRFDNINTLDMATHILSKLYESHPELQIQKTEAMILGFKTDMKSLDTRLGQVSTTMNALHNATQNLEARVQDQTTAESMQRSYQELRKEVDDLTTDGVEISRKVREAEKHLKTLTTDIENATKGLADLQTENEKNKSAVADQFATFQNDIEEEMERIKEAAQRPQPLKATSPAVSYTSNRSNQNGINRGPKPNFSTGNRQPSTATGGKANKKRKLDNTTSAKANGIRPNSSSGSPQGKKRRRGPNFGGDDLEDDPDFEEEIPQPGVSSDEE